MLANNYFYAGNWDGAALNYRRAEEVYLATYDLLVDDVQPIDSATVYAYAQAQGDMHVQRLDADRALEAYRRALDFAPTADDRAYVNGELEWMAWDDQNLRSAFIFGCLGLGFAWIASLSDSSFWTAAWSVTSVSLLALGAGLVAAAWGERFRRQWIEEELERGSSAVSARRAAGRCNSSRTVSSGCSRRRVRCATERSRHPPSKHHSVMT